MSNLLKFLVALLIFSGLVASAYAAWTKLQADLSDVPGFSQVDWVGAEACVDCHQDRHDSWYRTYHRTMTQMAGPQSVVGKFDGQWLEHWGGQVRPVRDQSGGFHFEYYDPDSGSMMARVPVAKTVGSHRYQQYLARIPDQPETLYRLHYLWHIEDQRWVHMNAVFLGRDQQHFDDQVALWNHNCISCHNTGPQPRMINMQEMRDAGRRGEPVNPALDARFESSVAELGISCETCHSPGAEHVSRNQSWLRRTLLSLSGASDTSIVNPAKLDHQRSTHVCAACHGARMPLGQAGLEKWVSDGPQYRAGDWLFDHQQPIWHNTPSPMPVHQPEVFSLRFWADGSPRLSAYEFQGLAQSECYTKAELSCIDCHSMHGGDVAGMIPEINRGNRTCVACHEDIAADLVTHTRHEEQSPGSNCYNCHMPVAVYGVMTLHRTHHIEVPDPAVAANAGKPNACTNCHQDKSLQWVAEQLESGWGRSSPVPALRRDGVAIDIADGVASLMAGDPVQKAVGAYSAGWNGSGIALEERLLQVPHLLRLMHDHYPSSRRFARNALINIVGELNGDMATHAAALKQSLEAFDGDMATHAAALKQSLEAFDFIAAEAVRNQQLQAIDAAWQTLRTDLVIEVPEGVLLDAQLRPDDLRREALWELGQAIEKQIDIGE